MTKDQKLLVSADILRLLTNAEQKITELEEAQKTSITEKDDYPNIKPLPLSVEVQKGSIWNIGDLRCKVTNTSENGTVAVTGLAAAKSSVVIKPTVQIGGKTFSVTEISAKAFQKNRKLKKVTIGKKYR